MYKVGFIGLGIMGRPMCKNLLKAGYAVTAFAKEALDDVVSCGAARGESNADVASKSDVVITMVPNSPHVRAAVLGKGGVAEGAHEGLDVIDMSSIDPTESKAIGAELLNRGHTYETDDALLYVSKGTSRFVSNWHVRFYRYFPKLYNKG